jgi:hypothetical protein
MANPSGVLCRINQHSQTIKRLDNLSKASLPTPLNQHCHVANLRDKTLVIHAESNLWATRLRLLAPELLRRWQGDSSIPLIDQVLVRVRPPLIPEKHTVSPPPPINAIYLI